MSGSTARIGVEIGADTGALDAGFRTGLQSAQQFVETLKRELDTRVVQLSQSVAAGILKPQDAAAAGAAAGREFKRALDTEISTATKGLSVGAERDGYISGLQTQLRGVETASSGAGAGLLALRRPITALADSALGVSGPVGNIVSRLGLMSIGGPLIVGVIAGVAAVSAGYTVLTHEAHVAEKAVDDAAARIANLRDDANSPIRFDVDIRDASKKIDLLLASADKWRRLSNIFAARDAGGPTGDFLGDAARAGGAVLNAVTFGGSGRLLGGFFDNKANDATREANRDNAGLAQAPAEELKREAADLARVITERVADNAQRTRALQIIREQHEAVARLQKIEGGTDAERRQRTHDIGEAAATAHLLSAALDGVAAKAKTAEDAIARVARAQQSAREAFAAGIAAQSPGTADDDATKLQHLVDQAKQAKLASKEIAEDIDKFDTEQGQRFEDASRKLTARLRAELANGIGAGITAARQALQEFEREIAENASKGVVADPAIVAGMRAQKAALADAADEAKRLKERIDDVSTSSVGPIQKMRAYLEELDQAQAAVDATAKGTIAHAAAVERLKLAQAAVADQQRATKDAVIATEAATTRLAGTVGAVASAAAGLATAFVGANSEITQTLVGVASVATGIEKISAAATKTGGLGKLLSTGAGAASIIPEIGGIIAGVGAIGSAASALFGKSDAEKQRDRTADANERAAKALEKIAGDLAGLAVSGTTFGLARDVVGQIVSQTSGAKGSAKIKNVGDLLTSSGLSAEDLTAIAAQLHITIDGTVDSYRKLDAAIHAADFAAFVDSWAGAVAQFDLVTRVDGVTDPAAKLRAFADTALKKSGSSLIEGFLSGATLDTSAGRAAAREAARQIVQQILDGTVDPAAFGKLNGGEILQFLETFIGDIDAVVPAAAAASDALSVLSGTLSDIALLSDLVGQSVDTIYQAIDAATQAFPKFADGIRGLVAGIDFSTVDGQQLFKTRVAQYAQALAAGGLTDDERGVLQFLAGLVHGLPVLADAATTAATGIDGATASLKGLGDAVTSLIGNIGGALSQIQSDGALRGLSQGQIDQQQADVFNTDPNLRGLFGVTNINDPAHLAQQRDHARDLLGNAAFLPPEVAEAARSFIQFANGLLGRSAATGGGATATPAGSAESRTSSYATVSEATASLQLEIDRSQLTELRGIRSLIASISAAALTPLAGPPASALAGLGIGGGIDQSVHVGVVEVHFDGAPDPEAAYLAGQQIRAGLQSLSGAPAGADSLTRAKFFAGDRTVRGRT